jgi:hypothetical protein
LAIVSCGLVAFLSAFAPSAAAQQAASSIAGSVRDATGAVLPGVTVEASSDALIEKTRTVLTDSQGQYRIVDLRSGTYVVTFTLPGFATVRREGIELSANFTAPVNIEMRVGALEETVTVSGATPLVDVQSVTQRRVLQRDLLDALPTGKTIQAYATLTVGAIVPATSQDVGGNRGELAIAIGIHGNRAGDLKLLQDGMRFNSMEGSAGGGGRGFYVNAASAQEVSIQTDANSAEYETGGVMLNVIPKEGGNVFRGYLFGNFTNGDLQSSNLSDALQARGLRAANTVRHVWDANVALGGPILEDKLWFYTAHRSWGNSEYVAGTFYNKTQGSLFYTPDLERQGFVNDVNRDNNIRFTWQASQKNKFNVSYDIQKDCVCHTGLTGNAAPEAVVRWQFEPNYLIQTSWTYTMTNKVLFEAGNTSLIFDWPNIRQFDEGVTVDTISILEQSNNYRYNASVAGYGNRLSKQSNQRFAVSYVTGSHTFKTGLFMQEGWRRHVQDYNQSISYTFNNQRPTQITQYAPIIYRERLKLNYGIFVQDQWTVDRLTINAGIRYDHINSYVPAQDLPAGRFVAARSFAEVKNVPNWKDISPRIGGSYDLGGDGKTAIKVSFGRYVAGEGVNQARANNPVLTSVNNVNRQWNDLNGDYIIQGDLNSRALSGELGPMLNQNFGGSAITTRYADDVLNGLGSRFFNWQLATSVQRELGRGLSMNVGYFRTRYGNFTTTENVALTAADFDTYCITAPSHAQLPNGGGNQLCGLYDVKASGVGRVNNLVNLSEVYGQQTEAFNGVDVTFGSRLSRGSMISGGVSTGRTTTDWCHANGNPQLTPTGINPNTATDPRTDAYCHQRTPWMSATQVKLSGSYALPWWGLQTSGTFQNLPGIPVTARYVASNAVISPSLGRNLNGAANATINLIPQNSIFEKRISQVDTRVTKVFRLANSRRVQVMFDVYNVLNANSVLAINNTYGAAWLTPIQILGGRLAKFGAQFDF